MARCKICKSKFEVRYFLQKACLNPACLAEWAKLDRESKVDKKYAQKKRELKANDRTFRTKEAQKAFNAYIRKRDEKEPCISCQRYHSGQYHAGHFKTTAARPDLRFNEDNCHKQCAPCNNHLSGNIGEYIVHLIKKIGQTRLDDLNRVEIVKYSCDELKEIELKYKRKLKELME